MEMIDMKTNFAERLSDLRYLWTTNRGALDITHNSILSLLRVVPEGEAAIHIGCVDGDSIDYFRTTLPFATLINMENILGWTDFIVARVQGAYNNYGTAEFRDVSYSRYFALMHMMAIRDAPILYTDGDIVYRKDPRPYLKVAARSPGAEILIQSDLPFRTETRHDEEGRVILGQTAKPNHCTGLTCWATAARTRALVTRLITIRDPNDPDAHDQRVLNGLSQADLTGLVRLPELTFLNGSYLFGYDGEFKFPLDEIDDLVVNACAVHANWMIGIEKKTAALKRLGLWRL